MRIARAAAAALLCFAFLAACSSTNKSPEPLADLTAEHRATDLLPAEVTPLPETTPTADAAPDGPGPEDARTLPEALIQDTTPDLISDTTAELGPEAVDAPGEVTDGDTGSTVDAVDISPDVPLPPLADLWTLGTIVDQCGPGLLATLPSPSGELRILVVRGSHYDMGYQAGCLIGKDVGQFFDNLIDYFLKEVGDAAAEMGLDPEQSTTLLFAMLNNIWLHVAPFVPDEYEQEIAGFEAAVFADPENAAMWGDTKPEWALHSLILLSNISDLNWSGSLEDVLDKLDKGVSPELTAFYDADTARLLLERFLYAFKAPGPRFPFRTTCSFFAAWGQRTVNNHLLASRNLDWSTDTGISVVKGITVFAPDGEFAHASIGYLGFVGALAGINEKGVALSEVGSESVMERLTGQPWTVKFREILGTAKNLEGALTIATGSADGPLRPPTIGYNWMAAFGDPPGGADAAAAAIESNGIVAGIMEGKPDCSQTARLVHYAQDGSVAQVVTNDQDPFQANLETEAVEVDADGEPRLFQVDEEGTFVLDNNGNPISAPEGKAFPVGRPLDCALYRGDEALLHGVRRWQTASNGPQGSDSLLYSSGSYRHRYLVMHDLLQAYETGQGYSHNGTEYAETTGTMTPVGLPQAEMIARAAAMGSNVLSIAYDATALSIRVSYEIGTGETWEAAHKHDYVEIDLKSVFDMLKISQ